MKHTFYLIGRYKIQYILSIVFAVLVSGTEAALQPLIMKSIFDSVVNKSGGARYVFLSIEYLTFGITVNAASYASYLWKSELDNRIVLNLSSEMLETYFSMPYRDFLEHGSGHYVSRIRSDVKDGFSPILTSYRDLLVNIMSLVVLVSVLFYISPKAFFILILLVPFCAAVSINIRKKIKKLTNHERDYEALTLDNLNRAIQAIKIVTTFDLIKETVESYTDILKTGMDFSLKKMRMVRILQVIGDLTRLFSDVMSIIVGAFLVLYGTMTVGSFIAFMNAFWRSSSTLFNVLNKYSEVHSYSSIVERIACFKTAPVSIESNVFDKFLVLENVEFYYKDENIINGFSMIVEPLEKVLIIGKNGSGKTTLGNIISGHLKPTAGSIRLPKTISCSTLPIHFPPTSVKDLAINKSLLARIGLGEKKIKSSRPDFLSVGQQQKLSVALAISANADLYVLDEPFANLDTDSRTVMLSEIFSYTRHGSLIVIAHDVDDYKSSFDRIINISEND